MRLKPWQRFLQLESSSGIILFGMALMAMVWANSPLAFLQQRFVDTFLFIINDGLMAIFFLVVGLELKKAFISGQLSRFSEVALPLVAAFGGMLVPACVYWVVNRHDPVSVQGWTTPVATDIAFALAALSIFGKRVPAALKLFLLMLAIFDDLGAILVIAIFYTSGIECSFLMVAGFFLLLLYLFNVYSIRSLPLYLLAGVGLWLSLLYAGIHPTIAGVLLGLMVPGKGGKQARSPLHRLEAFLHPYVAYFIMPLFALANAGFDLHALSRDKWWLDTVVMGIALGLFLGKQIGVLGFSWLLTRLRLAKLPEKSTWLSFYGVAILCGIGFTMSLFLGTLSFQTEGSIYLAKVRLGVLLGSTLSGLVGVAVFFLASGQLNRRKRIG